MCQRRSLVLGRFGTQPAPALRLQPGREAVAHGIVFRRVGGEAEDADAPYPLFQHLTDAVKRRAAAGRAEERNK